MFEVQFKLVVGLCMKKYLNASFLVIRQEISILKVSVLYQMNSILK